LHSAEVLSLEREKDAVRIQAAAVAAQQAALTEEEARLHQCRIALEQQEKQLAAHLENQRCQLLRLRDETRQAEGELQAERQAHEQRARAAAAELAQARQELETSQNQCQAERRRLEGLRGKLKRRWHRHWAAQRQAMRGREAEVEGLRLGLQKQQ